jgi:pantetheine-phosphate adenylyltransferase
LGVYAGSFDPLTVGHLWMIEQGVALFDRLVVAIGINSEKQYTFSLPDRLTMLRASLEHHRNLEVTSFANSYLIDYAQQIGATHILRGIRSASDYEYERTMRNITGDLDASICTVFVAITSPTTVVARSGSPAPSRQFLAISALCSSLSAAFGS